ncbi:hypothetical protein DESAMIL20_276 [Desulfurella amilsii]|uniref:Uncharacterized protein n=1 Tax=Desulfurella amilsii TaxID=1562698 RepID=A0A1X4Y058_9BACT|nr:hypothetical protein DESAMIL20_276 [Desulfurella amilsii]
MGEEFSPRPSRSEAFPPFGIKPNIKAKQFSIPFKKNLAGGNLSGFSNHLSDFYSK